MYAIIRAGGKQAKVHEGDVLDVERIKKADTVSFTPLLIVSDDGTVISDKGILEKATVTADVLGPSAGPKVDIFKYKAKTGYRRRQGHRQKYTTIKVTKIDTPGASSKPPKAKTASSAEAEGKATTVKAKKAPTTTDAKADEKKATPEKATEKKATEKKATEKKADAKKADAKKATPEKADAKKADAKKATPEKAAEKTSATPKATAKTDDTSAKE